MTYLHKAYLFSPLLLAVFCLGLPLQAQVPDSYQATDELEFFEDYYLQDESFERRFLGTDEDIDEYGDEIQVQRFDDSGRPIDLEREVYRDSDDFEPYGKGDFARQFEVPSQYIDRSDQTRDLMPESYGTPYSLEHPHAPVKLKRNSPNWYKTYYSYDRFADSRIEDDADFDDNAVFDREEVADFEDALEIDPRWNDREIDLQPEVEVKSGLLYDDDDDEFWYE